MPNATSRFFEHDFFGRRLLGRMLPLIVFIGTGIATELILFEEQRRQTSVHQLQLISASGEIRAIIESELNATIHLASGLVSFIQTKNGHYQNSDIVPWLSRLQVQERSIRNITLAPNNRIQTIVPLQGNESAIGIYFPDMPEQWPAIEQIIISQRPALVGPFQLKQGGLALAYRVPVFLDNNDYWGLVTTILDAELVFRLAKQRANELRLDFAIFDLDRVESGTAIYGKQDLGRQPTAALSVNIPGRHIELHTRIQEDNAFPVFSSAQRAIGWLFAALLSFLLARTFAAYRRQAKTYFALNESQQRFLSAFNTAPQGMALINDEGHWISINPMLCDILGYDEYTLLKIPVIQLAENLAIDLLHKRWVEQGEDSLQFELALRHSAGHHVTCLISLAHVAHERPEKTYWIFQVIDISRRIAAEKKLQASAEYTQTILDNVAEGIVSTTLDGTLRSINPAAIAIWKQNGHIFRNTNFFHLLGGQSIAKEIEEFVHDVKDYGASQLPCMIRESSILDQEGNNVAIEFRISATEQKGEIELIIVIRDINERKRLEQMQSEFVSIVSHELRTPLTSIIGSLKLIEGGVFGALPDSLGRMIRIALQNSQQLALIINDILDMDKLVAGKMSFKIEALPIMPLIEQAVESNLSFAKQHQVEIVVIDELTECTVMTDAMRLQQILSNLLSNAAKYSRAKSKIEIHLDQSMSHVKISVQDFGEGVPKEFQSRLFKKFSQVDSSSTRRKGGTGLGLFICKEMVEHMNGEIGFESTEGAGSLFYFTMPLSSEAESTASDPTENPE
ncbi:ATP-binding protein [Undibacterium sp. Di24W]|uniref:ATP-binding protein n=1 Tax=Undibacterium sp. Di24W TaxID=3413033 RepID=UPI003BF23890